jgi:hypothetical protein
MGERRASRLIRSWGHFLVQPIWYLSRADSALGQIRVDGACGYATSVGNARLRELFRIQLSRKGFGQATVLPSPARWADRLIRDEPRVVGHGGRSRPVYIIAQITRTLRAT